MTREEAWSLLTEYNKEPFHLQQAEAIQRRTVGPVDLFKYPLLFRHGLTSFCCDYE